MRNQTVLVKCEYKWFYTNSFIYSSTHVVILCTALRQQLHTLLTRARPLCFSNVMDTRFLLIDTIDICILKPAHVASLLLRSLRLLKFKVSKQHLATEQCSCVTRCNAHWPATSKKYSQTSVHERLGSRTIRFTNKFSEHKASRMTYCVSSYEHASRQNVD